MINRLLKIILGIYALLLIVNIYLISTTFAETIERIFGGDFGVIIIAPIYLTITIIALLSIIGMWIVGYKGFAMKVLLFPVVLSALFLGTYLENIAIAISVM